MENPNQKLEGVELWLPNWNMAAVTEHKYM